MIIIKRLKFLIKELLNLINLEINLNPKNFKIGKANYNFKPENKYKFLIPPLKLNYNYNSSIINYKKNFLNAAFKTYFPTILEFQKKINYKSNKNFFLDLGCGFGPMAAAYLNYVNMKKSKNINYNYTGVDINEIAISWLKDKYKDKEIFNFILHNTELSKDYLQSKSKGIKTDIDSDASEVEYKIPIETKQNYFYLDGRWKNTKDSMSLVSDHGLILLKYNAKQVNIVASNNSKLEIFLDGNSIPEHMVGSDLIQNEIFISKPRLYNIINSDDAESHELVIRVNGPGFEIFTFTFG